MIRNANRSCPVFLQGRALLAPANLSQVIRQMKGYITKQCGKAIWQKSYYDHIIRDENDYLAVRQYIDENPAKWSEDSLYVGEGTFFPPAEK